MSCFVTDSGILATIKSDADETNVQDVNMFAMGADNNNIKCN